MVMVDKDIKQLVEDKNLIVGFNEKNLSSISYDVTIDKFVIQNVEENIDEYFLPGLDFIYVKTVESLNVPSDLCCKVIEKNSLMRLGLKVDGPLYQPGHKTGVYIRVWNISKKDILLKRDMKIAQLIFMKLNDLPLVTYDRQKDARYNNEEFFIK